MKRLKTVAAIATLVAATATQLAVGVASAADYRAEVAAVDPAAGRVTLKHGAIKALDMEAMTMAYRVGDPKMLEGLKAGDRVTFDASGSDGNFTVTRLKKAK